MTLLSTSPLLLITSTLLGLRLLPGEQVEVVNAVVQVAYTAATVSTRVSATVVGTAAAAGANAVPKTSWGMR